MSEYTVLITGANSGLGFSTCCRLIDEFLSTRPPTQTLRLIFTTRSRSKNDDTAARLSAHLARTIQAVYGAEAKTSSIRALQAKRIRIEGEQADLCSLVSVKRLGERMRDRGTRVDVLVCNAGIGGWLGLRWESAIWGMLTRMTEACTFPWYKIGEVGRVVRRQGGGEGEEEPALGETFTANVFGHYLLAHWLAPVMGRGKGEAPARVVWVSSIEAFDKFFDVEDLQALKVDYSYESSKRLTDLLALTSELPSTRRYVEGFFSTGPEGKATGLSMRESTDAIVVDTEGTTRPQMYVSHPGICVTSISGIPWFMVYLNIAALYLVRWAGSPWHPISSYVAAVSTTWLALAAPETLDQLEGEEGKGKWGAATDRMGNERVVRTETDGWGWGGMEGEKPDKFWRLETRKGRNKVYTREEREEFEAKGAKVWREMEVLRQEWEERLKDS